MTENNRRENEQVDEFSLRHIELQKSGLSFLSAFEQANLELGIKQWPPAWGNSLHILLFGDFDPPSQALNINSLGIDIYPEKVDGDVGVTASCIISATVSVESRTVASVIDAIRRINIFLGSWTLHSWGNNAIGWNSKIIHGSSFAPATHSLEKALEPTISGLSSFPHPVQKRIISALYWIREPRNSFQRYDQLYRQETLRIYVAYWNAFECLVDAINLVSPSPKLSSREKQQQLDRFIADHGGKMTPKDITDLYQNIVNPGLVGKASHALRICFGNEAEVYIQECFKLKEKANRLYDVRNTISHGDIDAENPLEIAHVKDRLIKLWMIVWRMFGALLPLFPVPVDPQFTKNE